MRPCTERGALCGLASGFTALQWARYCSGRPSLHRAYGTALGVRHCLQIAWRCTDGTALGKKKMSGFTPHCIFGHFWVPSSLLTFHNVSNHGEEVGEGRPL